MDSHPPLHLVQLSVVPAFLIVRTARTVDYSDSRSQQGAELTASRSTINEIRIRKIPKNKRSLFPEKVDHVSIIPELRSRSDFPWCFMTNMFSCTVNSFFLDLGSLRDLLTRSHMDLQI